jgi:hypothetical protein
MLCCGRCALQVERLQHKFSLIHSTLAQQATLQAAPAGVKQSDLTERLSLMSLSDSARWAWLVARVQKSPPLQTGSSSVISVSCAQPLLPPLALFWHETIVKVCVHA